MFSLDTESLNSAETRGDLEVARTTFAKNYQAARSAFLKNDLSVARDLGLNSKLEAQASRAKGLGIALPFAPVGAAGIVNKGARFLPNIVRNTLETPGADLERLTGEYDRAVLQANQRLPKGEDRFLTIAELRERVALEARIAREQADELSARSGLGGAIGSFVGSAVGSVHDPVNIGAMIATSPLASASLARFVAIEATTAGGSEALIQTQVVPFLMEQGLTHDQAVAHAGKSVLAATLMGGLLGAGFKIGGAAVSRLVKRIGGKAELDLDGIVAEYERLDAAGQLSPEQSEALTIVKEAVDAERSNTFGRTPEAIDRHVQNLQEAEAAAAEGRRTAVSRPAREGLDIEPAASPRSAEVVTARERRAGQLSADIRTKYRLHEFEDLIDQPEFREVAGMLSRETLDDLRKGVPPLEAGRIVQAIKELGGIKLGQELIADLEARGVTPKTAPGLFRRAGGTRGRAPRDLDELREDLHALGFFPEKRTSDEITLDELIDAIARDRSGEPVTNAGIDQLAEHEARVRNAEEADRFLREEGVDYPNLSDREVAFQLREKLLDRAEREGLQAHERLLARLAPDQAELEAEAFSRLADDLDARLSEIEHRVSIDDEGNVVLNAQESAAFPAEDIRIALEDGTILSAREVLDLQQERAKAIADFAACALGTAAE